jgi:hypothetical protein
MLDHIIFISSAMSHHIMFMRSSMAFNWVSIYHINHGLLMPFSSICIFVEFILLEHVLTFLHPILFCRDTY